MGGVAGNAMIGIVGKARSTLPSSTCRFRSMREREGETMKNYAAKTGFGISLSAMMVLSALSCGSESSATQLEHSQDGRNVRQRRVEWGFSANCLDC